MLPLVNFWKLSQGRLKNSTWKPILAFYKNLCDELYIHAYRSKYLWSFIMRIRRRCVNMDEWNHFIYIKKWNEKRWCEDVKINRLFLKLCWFIKELNPSPWFTKQKMVNRLHFYSVFSLVYRSAQSALTSHSTIHTHICTEEAGGLSVWLKDTSPCRFPKQNLQSLLKKTFLMKQCERGRFTLSNS